MHDPWAVPPRPPWQAQFFAARNPVWVAVGGGLLTATFLGLGVLLFVLGHPGALIGFGIAAVLVAAFYTYGLLWLRRHRDVATENAERQRAANDRRLLGSPWFYGVVLPIVGGISAVVRTQDRGDPWWQAVVVFVIAAAVLAAFAWTLIVLARRRRRGHA